MVADLYAGTVVLKLYSAGLAPVRGMLVEALRSLPGVRSVLGRDQAEGEEEGRLDRRGAAALGRGAGGIRWSSGSTASASASTCAGGRRPASSSISARTGRWCDGCRAGASVLNCFSFSGGFSVNAALGGASRVFSVDQDADAIALARENFGRNGLDPNAHDFLAADVFTLLSSFREEGRRFDIVVLDPPAFAKSQRAVEAAIDGYASLNRQALELVAPGGLLVTASLLGPRHSRGLRGRRGRRGCQGRSRPDPGRGALPAAGPSPPPAVPARAVTSSSSSFG